MRWFGWNNMASQSFLDFEKSHVHNIYDKIAEHFTKTRYRIWPGVEEFLKQTSPLDTVLDVGCGNGKNILTHDNIFCVGIDRLGMCSSDSCLFN